MFTPGSRIEKHEMFLRAPIFACLAADRSVQQEVRELPHAPAAAANSGSGFRKRYMTTKLATARAAMAAPPRIDGSTDLGCGATSMIVVGSVGLKLGAGAVACTAGGGALADTAAGTLEWWQSLPEERRANPRRWPSTGIEQAAILQLTVSQGT